MSLRRRPSWNTEHIPLLKSNVCSTSRSSGDLQKYNNRFAARGKRLADHAGASKSVLCKIQTKKMRTATDTACGWTPREHQPPLLPDPCHHCSVFFPAAVTTDSRQRFQLSYWTFNKEALKPSGTTTQTKNVTAFSWLFSSGDEGVGFHSAVIGRYGGYSSSQSPIHTRVSILFLTQGLPGALFSQEVRVRDLPAHPVRLRGNQHPKRGHHGEEDVLDAEA